MSGYTIKIKLKKVLSKYFNSLFITSYLYSKPQKIYLKTHNNLGELQNIEKTPLAGEVYKAMFSFPPQKALGRMYSILFSTKRNETL